MTKIIYAVLGFLSLGLGILGMFLPVLPTVPFLLLASFFFLRGSERMHKWLTNHRSFGPSINNYMQYRAMRKSAKLKAILTLWGSLGLSLYIVKNFYVDILLIVIGISVSLYLLSLNTLSDDVIASGD